MQTRPKWPLAFSLGIIAAVIALLNYSGRDYLVFASNALNLAVVVPFIVLSVFLAVRNKISGSFGKAWICFAIFAVCWSAGEIIWAADELVFEQNPFPSEADFFWLLGYPAYFAFAILYLGPFKNSISKKILALAVSVSIALMAFLAYCAITKSELPGFETALLTLYPIGDAICLAPTIIGLALFFRGRVNFTWLLLLVGMFSFIVADSAYQIISQTGNYYTGHPFDIVYIWAYMFFVFGLYHHIGVFRTRNQENKFYDQTSLR